MEEMQKQHRQSGTLCDEANACLSTENKTIRYMAGLLAHPLHFISFPSDEDSGCIVKCNFAGLTAAGTASELHRIPFSIHKYVNTTNHH